VTLSSRPTTSLSWVVVTVSTDCLAVGRRTRTGEGLAGSAFRAARSRLRVEQVAGLEALLGPVLLQRDHHLAGDIALDRVLEREGQLHHPLVGQQVGLGLEEADAAMDQGRGDPAVGSFRV
jgi:hypothetical protein